MHKLLRTFWTLASTAFHADTPTALGVLALTALNSISTAALALGLKTLTNAAITHNGQQAGIAAAALTAALAATQVATFGGLALRAVLRERTSMVLDSRLIMLTTKVAGIEHYERPDYLRELELLRAQHDSLAAVQDALVVNLGILARVVVTLFLLGRIHPLLLLLPLLGIPSVWIGVQATRGVHAMLEATAEPRRLENHFYQLATSATAGKELRVFGLGDELILRHRRLREEIDRQEDRARLTQAVRTGLGWLLFGAGITGALIFVAERAVHHQATAGDMVLMLILVSQLNTQVAGLATMVSWLQNIVKAAKRYRWLVEYAPSSGSEPLDQEMALPPGALSQGIDLHGVSFRYPGTEVDVLEDVCLHLPAGATVAIVGDNGAGKSTLVKLLCRFYEPTSGRITVDSVDLQRTEVQTWREHLAVGFQDFARFELLARETVGVGNLPQLDDARAVQAALTRACAVDVIAGLPSGLETQVGRSFAEGVELSGGQWQKLALGRTMMRPAPLLLMLDEPTAALDAAVEQTLFELYANTARRIATTNGAITILVSHRFSTVRMADCIVVLEGNRVAEAGTHQQLMATGGLYAGLYELQARAYR